MRVEQFERMGLSVIPGAKHKEGDEFYMCCPFCIKRGKTPDTNYKLGFNVRKNIFHCHRCGEHGPLKNLNQLAILADYRDYGGVDQLKKMIEEKNHINFEPVVVDLDKISFKFDQVETPFAWAYMINRGYTEQELRKMDLRVGKAYLDAQGREIQKWKGRIIFPFFYEGKCIYAVGRSYNGKEPRYLNESLPKGLVVYGLDEIQGRIVILCEGVISAHAAHRATGISAVAVLGKDPLDLQLSRIRNKCEVIYISLDGDVEPIKKQRLTKRLSKMGFKVWDVELPDGSDPDDLKSDYLTYFQKARKLSLF